MFGVGEFRLPFFRAAKSEAFGPLGSVIDPLNDLFDVELANFVWRWRHASMIVMPYAKNLYEVAIFAISRKNHGSVSTRCEQGLAGLKIESAKFMFFFAVVALQTTDLEF